MQERVKLFAAYTVLFLGGGAVLYLFFRYLAGVLFPFVLGWGIAMLVRGPADTLHKKIGISRGGARLLLAVFSAVLLGAVLFYGLRGLFLELTSLANRFGSDTVTVTENLREFLTGIPFIGERLATGDFLEEGASVLLSLLPMLLTGLADVLPTFLFTLGVAVIAAVYFCLDLDRIHMALSRRLPNTAGRILRATKDSALRAALSVLRAQGMLMLIAFVLMFLGFILLNVNYPLLLSGVIALLDFFPVLGVGLFLVPWGLLALLSGDRFLGVGLLILFTIIVAVRQITEPRLLGRGYGVHPLLTLLSLYTGGRLFGVFGLFLFPVLTLLLYEMLFADAEKKKRDLT